MSGGGSGKFVKLPDGVDIIPLARFCGSVLLVLHIVLLDGVVAQFFSLLELLDGVLPGIALFRTFAASREILAVSDLDGEFVELLVLLLLSSLEEAHSAAVASYHARDVEVMSIRALDPNPGFVVVMLFLPFAISRFVLLLVIVIVIFTLILDLLLSTGCRTA